MSSWKVSFQILRWVQGETKDEITGNAVLRESDGSLGRC
jgi:hypothetical protein